jgi:hypothetical protein
VSTSIRFGRIACKPTAQPDLKNGLFGSQALYGLPTQPLHWRLKLPVLNRECAFWTRVPRRAGKHCFLLPRCSQAAT